MEQVIDRHADGTSSSLMARAAASGITRMELTRTFQGEDTLQIDVESARPIAFEIGDTVMLYGEDYTLNKLPTATKEGERKYTYTLELEGAQYGLITAHFLLWDNITPAMVNNPNGHQLTGLMLDSLTGDAGDILSQIVLNANRVNGSGKWVVGTYPSDTDTLNFTLQDGTVLEALQQLCEQWQLEFEITRMSETGAHVINLRKEPDAQTPLCTFKYGRTGGLTSLQRSTKGEDIITRLYAYGMTTNIPTAYITESNSDRLCIHQYDSDTQTYSRKKHLSYVENASLKASYGVREKVETFDEMYPQRVGTVTAVNPDNVLEFYDSAMFDLNERDESGATKWLIAGTAAKIVFQTGQLAGYTFDIHSYTTATKKFVINANTENEDLTLPSEDSAAFQIAVGDTYILTDIIMPDSYVIDAENQLRAAAVKELANLNADMYQYTAEVDSRYIKRHAEEWGRTANQPFKMGDFIAIEDEQLGIAVTLRLTNYTRDILNDTHSLTIERFVKENAVMVGYRNQQEQIADIVNNANGGDTRARNQQREIDDNSDRTDIIETEVLTARGSFGTLGARLADTDDTLNDPNTGLSATNAKAAVAQTKADEASATATIASEVASDAKQTAESVAGVANEAKETANAASEKATAASTAATEAKQTADSVSAIATEAKTTASEAKAAATAADTKADNAATAAATAQTAAGTAQSKANDAYDLASSATTSASAASTAAFAADTKAQTAIATAATADAKAAVAQTKAESVEGQVEDPTAGLAAVKEMADQAQQAATDATNAAATAKETADNAASTATSAQAAAEAAQSDAATAKTTAEDVKDAVEDETKGLSVTYDLASAASTTAGQAKATAEAARSAASEAEVSASAAKTTAEDAKTVAEAAQSEASKKESSDSFTPYTVDVREEIAAQLRGAGYPIPVKTHGKGRYPRVIFTDASDRAYDPDELTYGSDDTLIVGKEATAGWKILIMK